MIDTEKYMTKTVHAKAVTKIVDESKRIKGKKSRAAGLRFEKRVRQDLENKGWIVDKWTNNLDYPEENINLPPEQRKDFKMIPAKPKFVFNPVMKRRIMMGNSSGFPDFIAFRRGDDFRNDRRGIIGVESKMDGRLDKLEKLKCTWLLENNVFREILIAQKGEKRGEIVYKKFTIKFKEGKKNVRGRNTN